MYLRICFADANICQSLTLQGFLFVASVLDTGRRSTALQCQLQAVKYRASLCSVLAPAQQRLVSVMMILTVGYISEFYLARNLFVARALIISFACMGKYVIETYHTCAIRSVSSRPKIC